MYRISTVFVGTLLLAAFGTTVAAAPTLDERMERVKLMDEHASQEALQRKARSEKLLRAESVPINASLPVIENEKQAVRRSKQVVAYRALALLVVSLKGEGLEQPIVEKMIKAHGLKGHFTPKERAFIKDTTPSKHDSIQFSWRYEAAWVLLWALGYVEELKKPTGICDVPRAVKFMRDRTTRQFIADAKLRPLSEILDQADRIYRYHWAVDEARLNDKKPPAGLNPGVTLERHYALNWLIGYMEQAWDEISTDT